MRIYILTALAAIGCGGAGGFVQVPVSIKLGGDLARGEGPDWPRLGGSLQEVWHIDRPGRVRVILKSGHSIEVFAKYTTARQKNLKIRQVELLPTTKPGKHADAVDEAAALGRLIDVGSRPTFVTWLAKQRSATPTSGPFDNASCRVTVEDNVDAFIELKHHFDGGWFIVLTFYEMDLFDGSK